MTLDQWTKDIKADLTAAGFEVTEYQGFPLVKRPARWDDGVRLLKFVPCYSCEKRIYAEGMLFVPAGSPH
jgi:hypothetical protein